MRIFGIGLSRTGTTSLSRALNSLGFPSVHYAKNRWIINQKIIARFQALCDIPISYCFEQLDVTYPGSKFIYTIRDVDAWLDSMERFHKHCLHFGGTPFKTLRRFKNKQWGIRIHEEFYGPYPHNKARMRKGYMDFDARVRTYFAQKPQDLLILNICGGEGYEKLCPFLGLEIPQRPFPRANVGKGIPKPPRPSEPTKDDILVPIQ